MEKFMKKEIITLMVGAAVFMINPAFGILKDGNNSEGLSKRLPLVRKPSIDASEEYSVPTTESPDSSDVA